MGRGARSRDHGHQVQGPGARHHGHRQGPGSRQQAAGSRDQVRPPGTRDQGPGSAALVFVIRAPGIQTRADQDHKHKHDQARAGQQATRQPGNQARPPAAVPRAQLHDAPSTGRGPVYAAQPGAGFPGKNLGFYSAWGTLPGIKKPATGRARAGQTGQLKRACLQLWPGRPGSRRQFPGRRPGRR